MSRSYFSFYIKQTNEIKAHSEIYNFVPKNQWFDYFEDTPYYDFECRVIQFKITEDTYEYIVTNLDKDEFVIQDIKSCKLMHLKTAYSYNFFKCNCILI